MKPDIALIQLGEVRFVLDTKWKEIGGDGSDPKHGISQGDVYQLYSYGREVRLRHGGADPSEDAQVRLAPPVRISGQGSRPAAGAALRPVRRHAAQGQRRRDHAHPGRPIAWPYGLSLRCIGRSGPVRGRILRGSGRGLLRQRPPGQAEGRLWQGPSSGCTRPKSSPGTSPWRGLGRSSSPPSNGAIGTTIAASWNGSDTTLRLTGRHRTSTNCMRRPSRPDASESPSGFPGAVYPGPRSGAPDGLSPVYRCRIFAFRFQNGCRDDDFDYDQRRAARAP